MATIVDYEIKKNKKVYPIQADTHCLDTEPLRKFCDKIQDYISCVERANVLISCAEGNSLFDIMAAIQEEISYGRDELEALMFVSHNFGLPMRQVFLAYSLQSDYHYAYERYILAQVIKILHDLGLKPMQIYRKINSLEHIYYRYRTVLEVLKAWKDGNYQKLKCYELKKGS